MDFQDLDQARALHGALLEMFVAHAGGNANPKALARVEQLCDAAANAVDDMECRVAMRGIKSYSTLFFSDDPGVETGSLSSRDYLRLRIYNALSAFRGRLGTLEAERLLRQAEEDAILGPLLERDRRRIRSGLDVFAARRLIDAGEHRQAVRRLARASRADLPTVIRYWYKVAQAIGGALGLSALFDRYRRARRRLVHRRQVVDLGLGQPAAAAAATEDE